jgi:UDP-3-O-[3-hydroxymyristoyl] glucosamine N-acyltransferase
VGAPAMEDAAAGTAAAVLAGGRKKSGTPCFWNGPASSRAVRLHNRYRLQPLRFAAEINEDTFRRRLKPVAAIGNPPGDEHNRNDGEHFQPERQPVRGDIQYDYDEPKDLALHPAIVSVNERTTGQLSFLARDCYTRAMKRALKEVAEFLAVPVVGDERVQVTGVASLESAHAGDLVFVEDAKNLARALDSRATAIIAGDFAGRGTPGKPLLIARQPRLAFARVAAWLAAGAPGASGIHPSALVHDSAKLGGNVTIEERAVIRESVTIGEGSRIGAGSVIGPDVKIGRDCRIYPQVTIYPRATLGDCVVIHAGAVLGSDGFGYVRDTTTGRYEKFPQIGRLEIEDDVEIGANSTVDRGALDVTRIRRGTKIDNLVHVGHNVDVGADVVIAAQAGLSGSAVVENSVIIGGQVGIADHVRIEAGAILGAQSGIPSNKVIRGKGVIFWGTPARPIKEYLKELAVLARLAKKEPSET